MLAAALALALAAPPACGLPPLAGPAPWGPGEVLSMEMGLLGVVRVGEVRFAVERPLSRGRVLPLSARARNTGRLGPIRRLAAVALSWVDARTLRPERYREESDEDGRRRVSDTRLAPPGPQVTMELTDGDRTGRAGFDREGEVLDAVSALYYLRAARLAPGDRLCLDLVANGKYWRVEGVVAAEAAPVEVPAGRFEALRVEATARRADGKGPPRTIWLWLGTDARRLPLAVVSEVDLGPVSVKLAEVRGGRRP